MTTVHKRGENKSTFSTFIELIIFYFFSGLSNGDDENQNKLDPRVTSEFEKINQVIQGLDDNLTASSKSKNTSI